MKSFLKGYSIMIPAGSDKTEVRIMKILVVPKCEPQFHEMAQTIEIDDECGGEFIRIRQNIPSAKSGEICIDPDEWSVLREAIEFMLSQCRNTN
jgi:hypothetical protein